MASREYDYERKEIDWAKLPFPDTKITTSFLQEHKQLVDALAYAICAYASQNRLLVDSDVLASFESLATAYRTLASGIYYEKPPDYRVQRELYEAVKAAIESYKKEAVQGMGVISVRDGDIRDALIFFIHLGFARSNGRSKGRAYLDFLRTQFKSEAFSRPASNIVLLP